MPARHAPVIIPAGQIVPASNGSTQNIRIENMGVSDVLVQATMTDSQPANMDGGFTIRPFRILTADINLTAFFAGVGAGPYFIWVSSQTSTSVSVSHG